MKRAGIIAAILVTLWGVTIFTLHLGQIRHNHLAFEVDKAFPPERPFVSGEIFATTLAEVLDHELESGFGWRPNDFLLWGPRVMADNNANRQLGIIMALRETIRVFKDHLTKISSNDYDSNLVAADTALRNEATRWMLPAAETKYKEALKRLRAYVAGLRSDPKTSRELNQRNVELIRLFQSWTDLLGDAHANLYRTRNDDGSSVQAWRNDDYFYHAQGYAHVLYHMMVALKREYNVPLRNKPVLATLFDEAIDPLSRAAEMKPLIVLDGSPGGIFANHRKNLDAYISEARQKMYSIREELER